MDSRPPILFIEDDHHLSDLLANVLSTDFKVTVANNMAQAHSELATCVFDIIIVDIQLPDGSGIDICKAVCGSDVDKPGIICLSGSCDSETVVKAYQIGVDDFISKPIDRVTFHQRIKNFYQQHLMNKQHESALKQSRNVAQTAMTQASSYGAAMQLMSNLNHCQDTRSLANVIMDYFSNDGLMVALQFRHANSVQNFDSSKPECSEVEAKVLDLLHSQGRIYHFGARTIFNDNNVSILVKNMPPMDTPFFDSLLDVVAKLVPAINGRHLALCHISSSSKAGQLLNTLMGDLSENVHALEKDKRTLMTNLEKQISSSFHALDMDETQEKFFIQLIEQELISREENPIFDHIQKRLEDCVKCLSVQEQKVPTISAVETDEVELF